MGAFLALAIWYDYIQPIFSHNYSSIIGKEQITTIKLAKTVCSQKIEELDITLSTVIALSADNLP